MNRPEYTKIIFCFCVLTIVLWHIGLQPQPAGAAPSTTQAVGRDNPFAKLPKKKTTSKKVSQSSQSNEKTAEFALETITLEFLDAKSLTAVVKEMLSEYGRVSADVETNSLVIWDTKENLEKIVTQIHEADKTTIPQQIIVETPRPELFLETVTLELLDAKSLTAVAKEMLSEHGRIFANVETNSLVIWDTKEILEKIITQIHEADKTAIPQQTIVETPRPELFLETVTLKFLDAINLELAIKKMSSAYGSISIDKKSNSLIICDTKENLELILAEIRKADKTPQQIMVEVVILDVQLNDDTEIGINWDILSNQNYDIGYRQNFTTARLGSTIQTATTTGNATAFNTTGLGGNFSVIVGTIRSVVHLIQQKRDVEVLASPSIMMVSGETGYVEAVEKLPYTEVIDSAAGGANALTTTEFMDVGVKLTVSATLTEGSSIFLTVEAEQNVATGASDTEVPIIDTRKAKTSLLLQDGQVVILGGLRRQEKTKEVDQIPIIGDLPIIGELFKSTNTVVNNSELVVFLSPHVYKGEPIPDDEMTKYNEITDRPLLSMPD
ncbi:MAG: secretin N-terminal domain-containing protein [Planctomycetota bacterium]|jgi:general secretion pathway protein D